MAEYIDRDKMLERLKFKRDTDNIGKKKYAGLECAIAQCLKAPTEDVVPRSEVEKIFDKYGNYNFPTEPKESFNNTVVTGGYVIDWYKEAGLNAKRIMELEAELIKAKQDVAKQIFEEIDRLMLDGKIGNTYPAKVINPDKYAELKKKYIGE